ncbi:MAG: hypothetical protein HGB37_04870 [Candidatus Moranbacteria bacterium]|nr:hypothetical protein [Candidatus Moranbacteria bacterium]
MDNAPTTWNLGIDIPNILILATRAAKYFADRDTEGRAGGFLRIQYLPTLEDVLLQVGPVLHDRVVRYRTNAGNKVEALIERPDIATTFEIADNVKMYGGGIRIPDFALIAFSGHLPQHDEAIDVIVGAYMTALAEGTLQGETLSRFLSTPLIFGLPTRKLYNKGMAAIEAFKDLAA